MFSLREGVIECRVVTDQLRPGGGVANKHRGLCHIGQRQQARLNFLRLDAKTAHFDLLIKPPQILQHAVSAPAHQITRAVQASTRLT